MLPNTKTEYRLSSTAAVGVLIVIILAAIGGYGFGSALGVQTVTIANTTLTDTSTSTVYSTVSTTYTVSSTVTTATYSIITDIGPQDATLSGTVKTLGLASTPTALVFTNQLTSASITVAVSNGTYSTTLPNHAFYTVQIKYTTSAGGLGAGECSAGGMIWFVQTGEPSITANWSC